jgi:putative nucleotidyltransferase with HDIG domain
MASRIQTLLRAARAYPARHVRWRIIAPFWMLTLLMAAGGTYFVANLVVTSFEERFNNQLAEASRVAADAVVRREREHLSTLRAIAFTEGLAGAAKSGDAAEIARIAEPIAANDRAEFVEVLDIEGRRLYGGRLIDEGTLEYAALDDSTTHNDQHLVGRVTARESDALGDKFVEIVSTPRGAVMYTAGPIYDGDELAGIVLVGTSLARLVVEIKHEALADVTIYGYDGQPLGSTFAISETASPADLEPDDSLSFDVALSTPVREHKDLSQRGYDLLYADLVARGERIGVYSVALPSSFVLSPANATRTQLVLLFAVATMCVLAVGWIISHTITSRVFKLVAAARAVEQGDLTARAQLHGEDEIAALGSAFDTMTDRLQRQHLSTIRALASAIDARDPYTLGHSLRVGQLAVEIGKEMNIAPSRLQHLEIGGYLHDIGKIGVRDNVLLKPHDLTPEERHAIELHPRIGLSILGPVELAPEVLEFVGAHHEKLDGSGYPAGLRGEQLGLVTRIATVADMYDALTTDRPYRAGMSAPDTLAILRREVGEAKLDAAVVDALERVIPRWESRLDSEASLAGFRADEVEEEKAA